jgi:hypothetical protein
MCTIGLRQKPSEAACRSNKCLSTPKFPASFEMSVITRRPSTGSPSSTPRADQPGTTNSASGGPPRGQRHQHDGEGQHSVQGQHRTNEPFEAHRSHWAGHRAPAPARSSEGHRAAGSGHRAHPPPAGHPRRHPRLGRTARLPTEHPRDLRVGRPRVDIERRAPALDARAQGLPAPRPEPAPRRRRNRPPPAARSRSATTPRAARRRSSSRSSAASPPAGPSSPSS